MAATLTLTAKQLPREDGGELVGLLCAVLDKVEKNNLAAKFSVRQCANVAWALGRVGKELNIEDEKKKNELLSKTKELFHNLIPHLKFKHMNPSEVTMTLWAYGSVFPRSNHITYWTQPVHAVEEGDEEITQMFDAALMHVNSTTFTLPNLAKISYSLAVRNHPPSAPSTSLLHDNVASRAALVNLTAVPKPRDMSMIAWSLSTLTEGDRRLGKAAFNTINSLSYLILRDKIKPSSLTKTDIIMIIAAMSHSRVDDRRFLICLFDEVGKRKGLKIWERVNLAWVVAHLYLVREEGGDGEATCPSDDNDVFEGFVNSTVEACLADLPTLHADQQASANIVWALTVLSKNDERSISLMRGVFKHVEGIYEKEGIEREHAHQLYQSHFLMEEELEGSVSSSFANYLSQTWEAEKGRMKKSSRSHLQLSKVLQLMKIKHRNEHTEDIDVAIVLDNTSGWSRVDSGSGGKNGRNSTYVAVEYDGPDHFTYNGKKCLGHTNLKYRVLKKKGWAVIRVPYYVWDRIPFWASMERQRYLQRLLKTDKAIRFSETDVSEYKEPRNSIWLNRKSRFD